MQALAAANEIRTSRHRLKRQIDAGEVTVESVLADIPRYAETMAIGELLRAQHRWGRARTRRFLVAIPIGEGRPLASLTKRQRDVLVMALRARAARRR